MWHITFYRLQKVQKVQKTEGLEKKKSKKNKKKKERQNTLSRIKIRLHLTSTQKFFNQEETSEIFKVLREKKTNKSIL